ncbi:MAG: hypothetical protein CFE29_15600 [Bradyrhizobiaceae bacterium PARB1]|nr:MAG: hypothetical protein CFE29_15600 [Bradyrhizobiaceae bacterium PARB1]
MIGHTAAAAAAAAVAATAAARVLPGTAAAATQTTATAAARCVGRKRPGAGTASDRAVVGKADIADRGITGIDENRSAGAEAAAALGYAVAAGAALGIAADQRDVLDRRSAVEKEYPVVALRIDGVAVALDGDIGRHGRQQRRAERDIVLQQDAVARRSARDRRGQLRYVRHQNVAGDCRRRPDGRQCQGHDQRRRCEQSRPQPALAAQSIR